MRIFHIATAADWKQAGTEGAYLTSTYGRTLAQEGYIHASRADQWQGVRERFYGDVTEPLVLLVIDSDRLTSPMVEEPAVEGGTETFPHIYGPINTDAVLQALPLGDGTSKADPTTQSFSSLFMRELFGNLAIGVVVMICVAGGALLGDRAPGEWSVLIGTAIGLVVGVAAAIYLNKVRRGRE